MTQDTARPSSKKKALILTNNIAPYRDPLFSRIDRKLAATGWELHVYFMREREDVRAWEVRADEMNYRYEILSGSHWSIADFREIHFNPSLWAKLAALQPEVIFIGGYNSISCWIALLYAKLHRKKVVMWNGSVLATSSVKGPLINSLRRLFIGSIDAAVTYGTKAGEFLEHYGAKAQRIFTGCNVGDVDFYRARLRDISAARRGRRPARLIFVGRLVLAKGLVNCLEALARISTDRWQLAVLGDGPDRAQLEQLCRDKGLAERVSFLGFKQKEELAAEYAAADIFVSPTLGDRFSIVLSEALASGLFVIASVHDGASYDIVKEKINGHMVDPLNVDALAQCLQQVIDRLDELPSKQAVADSVAHGLDLYAQQFVSAALCVTSA